MAPRRLRSRGVPLFSRAVSQTNQKAVPLRRSGPRDVGVVAIGRNEGERLQRCIRSLPTDIGLVVYVDSGSADGSAQFARQHGAEVVDLDMSRAFTAARARNAGVERLRQVRPELALV